MTRQRLWTRIWGRWALFALLASAAVASSATDWTQWGGPNRNFTVAGVELADRWPEEGPPTKWRRQLGEGYAGIVVRGNRLYTMYREGDVEVVVAAEASTGTTVWEHRYEIEDFPPPKMGLEYGNGPLATPLLAADRLFTAGIMGRLTALDVASGTEVWAHELIRELGGTVPYRGYSSSPVAFGETIITSVGENGHAVVSFRQQDGSIVWQRHDFTNAYASPLLMEVGGKPQVVQLMAGEVIGLDPATGDLLWSHAHPVSEMGMNISTPSPGPPNVLFVSSAYGGGSRVLRLDGSGTATTVEELWHTRRLRVHLSNIVWHRGQFIAANGDFGPTPLFGVEPGSGEIAWRDRALARANSIVVGDELLMMSEDGVLALAAVGKQGLEVMAQAQLVEARTWTVPTLVGHTLYLRTREEMLALELP